MENNSDRPAAKQDILNVNARIEDVNARIELLHGEMNHQYRDLVKRISDGETALLKAFHSHAESNNKRFTELEGNEAALRSRLATIEDRLLNVERRLDLPPAA